MQQRKVLVAVVILAVVSLVIVRQFQPDHHDVASQIFGGRSNYLAFITSDQVTAQRLRVKEGKTPTETLENYDRGEPVLVEKETAQKLKELLRQSSSYGLWDGEAVKNCMGPDYGVLLSFCSAQQTLRVALCFECADLGVFDEKDDLHLLNRVTDFHPISNELTLAVKSIFTNDTTIQALKTR